MKKYLMRGGINPLEAMTPDDVVAGNSLGANSGNLLYAFGVYRTLMTEDVIIDMDYYGVERRYKDEDIDFINQEYDAYICPLADAFRDAFTGKLVKYAKFFNKLKIPCYVIGLGMRSSYDGVLESNFVFDESARMFLKAVLNKSAMIGIRGGITGSYLQRLGFKEDRDFKVIGCPSMYTFGRELPQRSLQLDSNGMLPESTRLAVNMSTLTPENVLQFLFDQIERFPDHYCIEQGEAELRMLYYGVNYITNKKDENTLLPLTVSHPLLKEDRYRFFVNVATWFRFLRERDLSVGGKLHGNVAAVISGCPALFIPLDGRMRELIEYHDFPCVPHDQIKEGDTLEALMERVDMQSHLGKQAENFDRFIDFLDLNGLDHIYKEDRNRKDAPVDQRMQEIEYPEVTSILNCTAEEAAIRFNTYLKTQKKELVRTKKELQRVKNSRSWKWTKPLRALSKNL